MRGGGCERGGLCARWQESRKRVARIAADELAYSGEQLGLRDARAG